MERTSRDIRSDADGQPNPASICPYPQHGDVCDCDVVVLAHQFPGVSVSAAWIVIVVMDGPDGLDPSNRGDRYRKVQYERSSESHLEDDAKPVYLGSFAYRPVISVWGDADHRNLGRTVSTAGKNYV